MGFLLDHVNQETFESQREVVKNERRQNYENAPYGLVQQFIRAALYPAGAPVPPPHHRHARGPRRRDARRRAAASSGRSTCPTTPRSSSRATSTRRKTKALVEKYFGPIARGAAALRSRRDRCRSTLAGEKRLEVEAGVELPRVEHHLADAGALRAGRRRARHARRTCSPRARRAASTSVSSTTCRSRRACQRVPGVGPAREHVRDQR